MSNKLEKNKVLDLFSGCGGLSLGFKMAGFDIVGGVDEDKDSINTFSRNFKGSVNLNKNIKEISNKEILGKYKNIDILIGGPPCQGFSYANMQQKNLEYDERNLLFLEFLRFVKLLKPKVLLIENVGGILKKNNGHAKKSIEKKLSNLGYLVSQKILIASEHGVPQKRKRNFFIGVKKEYKNKFNFDNVKNKLSPTVGDAISDLYYLENKTNRDTELPILSDYQKLMRKKSRGIIHNHDVSYPTKKVVNRIKHVKEGGNWKDVPIHLWDTVRNNRHSSAYKRLDSKDVSITIDTGHMNYFHPKFNRVPTVRESARLQSFPDIFVFEGSKVSQLKQVGNAVPPLFAKEIALAIKDYLKENENIKK